MYFFIGIKGAGMSALAQIMKQMGYVVAGSDLKNHFFTQIGLEEKNIPFYEYNKENIKEDMTIIVGASIKDDHEEYIRAKELGLTIYSYAEMVGVLTKKYKTITIAGCHGKTTTTSMMSLVLNKILGCNYLIGDGTGDANDINKYFVLEACEYQRHFLYYEKDYAIITNIDLDHVDYFKNIEDVVDAYQSYVSTAKKYVIACGEDLYTNQLTSSVPIKFYGFQDDMDIVAKNIKYYNKGTSFDCFIENELYANFDLPIFGSHMVLDALAVIAVCYYEGINGNLVNEVFQTYTGAKRRFSQEIIGDNVVIDDYAHHPNEVKSILNAVKQKFSDKKIIGIIQPHTFSRTQEFALDFAKILNNIDKTYVLDIHKAREKQENYPNITSYTIINELSNGYHLNMDEGHKIIESVPTAYVIMSPNDLSDLKNDIINNLKQIKN